jgi:hypothetical protein
MPMRSDNDSLFGPEHTHFCNSSVPRRQMILNSQRIHFQFVFFVFETSTLSSYEHHTVQRSVIKFYKSLICGIWQLKRAKDH